MTDSFNTRAQFTAGDRSFDYFSLPKLQEQFPGIAKLPYAQKILLENLLRNEDGHSVEPEDIEALRSAQLAESALPVGSADWLRAQDVRMEAQAALERERDKS